VRLREQILGKPGDAISPGFVGVRRTITGLNMKSILRMHSRSALLLALTASALTAQQTRRVDRNALKRAPSQPDEWLMYRRDAETHYSPLKEIDDRNVSRLGLTWSYETNTVATFEGTPLIADGVIYATGSWSVVFAVDARTGKEIWRHDSDVNRAFGSHACCGPNNRGVAIYEGMVYVGVLDGRLIALDQKTGQSRPPEDDDQSITRAPRVVKGKVIIGNAGAEFGVRAYVTAYDAKTGKLVWRFYTIPGDPSKPVEHPELAQALKTWNGEWWKMGGGGTVWDAFAYHPGADRTGSSTGAIRPPSTTVRCLAGFSDEAKKD
jgi:quinohemoprotein ethanol dehydrogenase